MKTRILTLLALLACSTQARAGGSLVDVTVQVSGQELCDIQTDNDAIVLTSMYDPGVAGYLDATDNSNLTTTVNAAGGVVPDVSVSGLGSGPLGGLLTIVSTPGGPGCGVGNTLMLDDAFLNGGNSDFVLTGQANQTTCITGLEWTYSPAAGTWPSADGVTVDLTFLLTVP